MCAQGAHYLPLVAGHGLAVMAGLGRPRLPVARVLHARARAATALAARNAWCPHVHKSWSTAAGVRLLITPKPRDRCIAPGAASHSRLAQQGQVRRADRDDRAGRVDGRVRRDARRHPRPRAVHGRGGAGRAPAGRPHQRAHRVRAGRPALHRVRAARLVDRRARVGQRCLPTRWSMCGSARSAVSRVCPRGASAGWCI